MIYGEEFKTLTHENKRLLIETYLLPRIQNHPEMTGFLETFVLGASDDEMSEFYEVILHPEKMQDYIARQTAHLKSMNHEIEHLRDLFFQAKNEMHETLEKEDAESILNNI